MPPSEKPASAGRRAWVVRLRRLWPVLLLVAGLALFFSLGVQRYVTLESLARHEAEWCDWADARPVLAPLAGVTVYAAAVAFSLPVGLVLTILAGMLFGPLLGTLVVVAGATAGAVILFVVARTALGDRLRVRVEGALRRMDAGFRDNAFNYLLFLRLVPVFPFWLVNIAPAFTPISLRCYVLATMVGIVPGTLVYVLVGDGIGAVIESGGNPNLNLVFSPRIIAALVGLAALALTPVLVKRWRGRPGA